MIVQLSPPLNDDARRKRDPMFRVELVTLRVCSVMLRTGLELLLAVVLSFTPAKEAQRKRGANKFIACGSMTG